ncbi:DUF2231 domain-containing protein [Desulforhabdus amnigena]|uniref:Cytochrome c domain-containing protein n=1 Tax=Desulforhabdus amnigena TaxID=40218 RepID=A0A9W6D0T3_9BACT|nr:DUF2231 domain-containing protein [Desulforhabdus amnigena]GLI33208.1 hypothetical protein DAMNIGENAA_06410 [Desulforhabdus amnigena]
MNDAINSFYSFLSTMGYSHPIHPTQVHLVIGLIAGAFIFAALDRFRVYSNLAQSGRHCFLLAFAFFFPTVLFGFMDWQHFYSGTFLFPIMVKLALAGILLGLLFLGFIVGRRGKEKSTFLLTIYFVAFLTVGGLGYFGGQLVYGAKDVTLAESFKEGQDIFKAKCAGCHLNGGNVISPDHPVKGSSKLANFNTFLDWLRNPEAPMPSFPKTALPDNDAQKLYKYIVNVLEKG